MQVGFKPIQNKALKKAMDELGADLVKALVKALIDADKKVTGNLVRSIDYRLVQTAEGFLVQLLAADYLDIVDKGRKPGAKQPPLKALDSWIVRRGIAPRDKKGKFIPRESVKFLIARSISKKGIKGINVVRKTIDSIYSKKKELIAKAASEDLKALVDKILII